MSRKQGVLEQARHIAGPHFWGYHTYFMPSDYRI